MTNFDDISRERTRQCSRRSNDRGNAIVEYVLLIALLAVGTMVAVSNVGEKVNGKLTWVQEQIGDSVPGACRGAPGDCEGGESGL